MPSPLGGGSGRAAAGHRADGFFQDDAGDLVVSLYNQEEVWPKFGYEGSSAENGGYINRGFNDIDWLPKA